MSTWDFSDHNAASPVISGALSDIIPEPAGIFASNAPKYWAAGLPVIPLVKGEKRPAINGWQRFAEHMPDAGEQTLWLEAYPNGNMGLPAGPCSNVVGLDIDSDDPAVIAAIKRVLPK